MKKKLRQKSVNALPRWRPWWPSVCLCFFGFVRSIVSYVHHQCDQAQVIHHLDCHAPALVNCHSWIMVLETNQRHREVHKFIATEIFEFGKFWDVYRVFFFFFSFFSVIRILGSVIKLWLNSNEKNNFFLYHLVNKLIAQSEKLEKIW